MKLIYFVLLIFCFGMLFGINANSIEKKQCFNVNEFSIKEGMNLRITGNGKMCSCHQNELLHYQSSIQTIKFEDTVTSIGSNCFSYFTQLKTIEFGSGILEIEKYAFYQSSIQALRFPKSVKSIQSYSFAENSQLESITFENNEDENELRIDNFAFFNCEKLRSFHIPNQLKQFNRKIIKKCENIREITIEEDHDVFEVEENVLFDSNETRLIYYPPNTLNDNYDIPDNIEEIEEKAFLQSSLKQIKFPMELEKISQRSFYSNKNIKSLFIHENVDLIGKYSFAFSDQLETVIITTDVIMSNEITIEKNAFYRCRNLKNVILASETIEIEKNVFEECDKLKKIDSLITFDKEIKAIIKPLYIAIKQTHVFMCDFKKITTLNTHRVLSFLFKHTLNYKLKSANNQ